MRHCWLFGFTLALLAGALPRAHAVRYDDGAPLYLRVTVSATKVAPGQTVRLTLEAGDEDTALDTRGNPTDRVTDPVKITYSASGGELSKRSVGASPIDLVWQSPVKPGYYAIFAGADDSGRFADEPAIKRVIEITVAQAGVDTAPAVRVGANPQTIRLDQRNTSLITAQVFGDNAGGKAVAFYATGGRLSADTVVADADGRATVRLSVTDNDIGTLTVSATVGNTTSVTTVEVVAEAPAPADPNPPIVMPPPPVGNNPPGFIVTVVPASIPADGESTAEVRVRLTDSRGLPIPRQNVVFRATSGAIAPRMTVSDYYGFAVAQITAPEEAGGAYIVVDAGALKGYGTIVFTPVDDDNGNGNGGVPRIFLTIDPTEQMADGASRVRVEALVLDEKNRAVTKAPVAFSTTLGRLQQAKATTDDEGKAFTTLIAPDRPGLAVVTATAENITAASQVEFTGGTAAQAGLELKRWTGQQTYFAAPNWVVRQINQQQDQQTGGAAEIRILDDTGKGIRTVQLGSTGVVVSDQYGLAHGYCVEDKDQANIVLLTPDGTPIRTMVLPLAAGSDVLEARYAEPGGQVLVLAAQPDGTRPEVHLYAPTGEEVLALAQGLEQLPVAALGGDGFVALALAGGTVRLYNPTGQLVSEGRRTDGLQAKLAAIGPGGEWLAVASALTGQTERLPVVSVFGRQGGVPFATFKLEATALTPVSQTALAVATPDATLLLNLQTKAVAWKISGGCARFLPVHDLAILAGHHGEDGDAIHTRVTIVRLQDGRLVISQPFETGSIIGLLPPDAAGAVGVLSSLYTFRFKLPGR